MRIPLLFLGFLNNKAAKVATPDIIKNIKIGICLGLSSATCGAKIVVILAMNPHAENEKGTKSGGNTSEFT